MSADEWIDVLSRRELLQRAALTGMAAALPVITPGPAETLTATELETLEAIVARLIPTDDNGPGAVEAKAARYIDRALAGFLADSRNVYAAGLAAINSYAQSSKGAAFSKLPAEVQDAVLSDMENNRATGFNPNSAAFFSLVRNHTIQGTFSDPYYGGNANFAGWDLIGYPGVRMSVTAEQQKMDGKVVPNHRSAYDFSLFSKPQE